MPPLVTWRANLCFSAKVLGKRVRGLKAYGSSQGKACALTLFRVISVEARGLQCFLVLAYVRPLTVRMWLGISAGTLSVEPCLPGDAGVHVSVASGAVVEVPLCPAGAIPHVEAGSREVFGATDDRIGCPQPWRRAHSSSVPSSELRPSSHIPLS